MSRRLLTAVAGVLAVAVVAAASVAVLRGRQLDRTREQLDQARSRVDDLRGRIDELEQRLAGDGGGGDGSQPDDALGDLLGEDAGELLDSLGGEVPGAACLTRAASGGLGSLFGGDEAPSEPQALVDHIAAEVEDIRQLQLERNVDAELLTPEQTGRRVTELFLDDYSAADARTEGMLLAALGVVEPDTDLRETVRQLLEGQVAGFYVPETGELVVAQPAGEEISPTDRITLAHEIDHALTDQVLGLPGDGDDDPDPDAQLAATAVVEGDASLVMNRWALANLSLLEQLGMATDPAVMAAEQQLEGVPHYLVEELTFPYLDGMGFVCEVFRRGGWPAVNDLYGDPPESTAQVMFPDRHAADEQPADPPTQTAPPGWDRRDRDTFGAARLSWLFEAPGDATGRALSDPDGRARAWAGGAATVWERSGSAAAVGLSFVARGDADPGLCASVTAWYAAAFPDATRESDAGATTFDGDRQNAVVSCPGTTVRVGIGPDPDSAAAIAG